MKDTIAAIVGNMRTIYKVAWDAFHATHVTNVMRKHMNKEQEQWIQHEVKIQVLKETTSKEFLSMQKTLDRLDSKINWLVGIVLTTIITIALHTGGMV